MQKYNLPWVMAVAAAQEKLYTELPYQEEAVTKDLPPKVAFSLGYETAIQDIIKATQPDPLEVEIVQVPIPFKTFPESLALENTND